MECDCCSRWEHTSCSQIDQNLYACMVATPSRRLLFFCAICDRARFSSSDVVSSDQGDTTRSDLSASLMWQKQMTKDGNGLPVHSKVFRGKAVTAQRKVSKTLANASKPSMGAVSPSLDATISLPPPTGDSGGEQINSATARSSSLPSETLNQTASEGGTTWINVTRKPRRRPIHSAPQEQPPVVPEVPPGYTGSFPRENCIMMFRVPESNDADPQIRYNHDLQFLQSVIDKLLDPTDGSVRVRRILRLGQRSGGYHRPLRIVFGDAKIPKLILSRLWRLGGLNVHIRADIDPEKRELLHSAIAELKERRQQGESNLRIVNFRVVRWKTFINRAVTLTPGGREQPASSA